MRLIADTFERHHVPHALIGGMAIAYRANPRMTVDIDFIVAADSLTIGRVVGDLVAGGFRPAEREILKQWSEDQLAVLRFGPVRVDWLKPVLPLYRHIVDSAEKLTAFGRPLSVASVEGLILCKLLADRPQDRADIATLVFTHQGEINLQLIEREWATVGEPNAPQLLALRAIVENPDSAR
ncbi:MAG TPA: nucleotidyl transferase AbiEii/AbiGii toxin family protein, partial [Caulifigura sp.]|nr:nucleotidyl transferase AbiEii/AbiGii toxin family protein [Caulifigura sp.]